jgi:predicted GIY-YIG superfamily endonuclease
MGYTYILLCADGTYYTGSTKDLKKRLQEHQSGRGAEYTSSRLPFQLLYYALIEGNFEELSKAAKKIFRKPGCRVTPT